MSLINDALKRARTAQQESAPSADGPALQPVHTPPPANVGASKMLFYVLIGCVIIGNLFLFLYASKRDDKKPEPVQVEARELTAAPVVTPAPSTTTVAPTPVAPVEPAPSVPAVVATIPPVEPTVEPAPTTVTNEPPPVVFVTPQPVPLRLQSVVMNAARPSAMISGKFLFVGDRIQGYRVTAISQESVTLVGNGQTNVLVLP
jgi:type IV secretory pathway VirB10-like protein